MRVSFGGNIDRVLDFVRICESFQDPVDVKAGRYMVDGRSLLGVMAICSMPTIDATLLTTNPSAQQDFADAMREYMMEG